jgi:hypothetical protein
VLRILNDPPGRRSAPAHRLAATAAWFGVLAAAIAAGQPPGGQSLIGERLPRVVHRGGPFLRAPVITTVTFAGDEPSVVERLESFGELIGRSAWWAEVMDGYCAGADDCIRAGRGGRRIRLPQNLPPHVSDVQIEALLEEEADAGALTDLEREALVLVYLPPRIRLSDAFNPFYCDGGPRGFHRMLRTANVSFPFAVIPRCGGDAETTATASHEIVEAATNPDPGQPGFGISPGSSAIAFAAAGAEPVDPCRLLNFDHHRTDESGFYLQRAWSNRRADAGRDPCVPSVRERPYAALIPRTPVVRLDAEGATASIVLDAVADRPMESWRVSTIDLTGEQEGVQYVEARLDKTDVASGDVATLTIRVLRLHPRQISIVGLVSRVGTHAHLWPVAVSMR